MKISLCLISLFILVGAIQPHAQENMEDFPKLSGPYLGQNPPGITPHLFAPGIVSIKLSVHSSTVFSPDGSEMFWTVMNGDRILILTMKQINGLWTEPAEVPFAGPGYDANPFFSPDGERLYFKSTRDNAIAIWFVRRENNSWSIPSILDTQFSSGGLGWQASITRNDAIYFVKASGGFGTHDIYRSKYANGSYQEAQKLPPPLNSEIHDWQVFVDPDEEYIIFGRYQVPDSSHQNGLYISFQHEAGTWTQPESLGEEINGEHGAYWPYVSPDKKYLFFVSDMANGNWHYDVYWVEARILDNFRPSESEHRDNKSPGN